MDEKGCYRGQLGPTATDLSFRILSKIQETSMQSKATTVEEYLSNLPDDRRAAVQAVRSLILANLDADFEEGMQYGMIGYYVPHRIFPAGYHCNPAEPLPFAGLASQKNHMSLYLMCHYMVEQEGRWFREAWQQTGKKLDMGKSCIRFKTLDDLALEVIAEAIRRVPAKAHVDFYLAARNASTPAPRPAREKSAAKKASKAAAVKKTAAKKARSPKGR